MVRRKKTKRRKKIITGFLSNILTVLILAGLLILVLWFVSTKTTWFERKTFLSTETTYEVIPLKTCRQLCTINRNYEHYRDYRGGECMGLILTQNNGTHSKECCCYDDLPDELPDTTTTTTLEPIGECMSTSLECGRACTESGYNLAQCGDGYCPYGYTDLGDYYNGDLHCSDNPPCDRCCCKYVEPPSTTTTVPPTTPTVQSTTTTVSSPTTTIPMNPVCGHSSGQYCEGYDVAYHTDTYSSTKCNDFPKFGGLDCLYDCVYKGLDNYDMYCWCWDKESCSPPETCQSDGCHDAPPTTTTTTTISPWLNDCEMECSLSGRDYKFCASPSWPTACRANSGILLPAGDYGCDGFECCCEWKDTRDVCNSYGYTNLGCINPDHPLIPDVEECCNDQGGILVPAGDYLCSTPGFRLCCRP